MRPRAICTQAIKLPSQIVSEISGADEQIYLYVIYEAMKEKGKCIIRRKIMDTSALKDYKCDVILVNMACNFLGNFQCPLFFLHNNV